MDFLQLTEFSTAKRLAVQYFGARALETERVAVNNAAGRICALDLTAPEDLPRAPRSVVDGYAVNARDVALAGQSIPALLDIQGEIAMGDVFAGRLAKSGAVAIPTGGFVPEGADAVVMLEHTELCLDKLAVYSPACPGENIVAAGADIRKDALVIKKNTVITPNSAALLAALGIREVTVYSLPRVSIISTGDELVPPCETPKNGEIRDANTTLLCGLCARAGFRVVSCELIADDLAQLTEAVKAASERSDLVLLSGGSSVGARDYTQRAFSAAGEVLVSGIAIKPGKPTVIAKLRDALAFGLPGHPMACSLVFELLVEGAFYDALGISRDNTLEATAAVNFPSSAGKLTAQPVRLEKREDGTLAHPIFYKSALLSVLAAADGFVLIPENAEGIYAEQRVEVHLL